MLYTRHFPPIVSTAVSPHGSCAQHIGVENNENGRERARFCVSFGIENYFTIINFEVHDVDFCHN